MHEPIDNLNFVLLNIGFSELNANWNWKRVYSPFARIYYVTDGQATTYIDGRTYELRPGNLYLVPPFTMHDDECDGLFSLYYIHLHVYENNLIGNSLFDRIDFPVEIGADTLDLLFVKRLLEINEDRDLKQTDPEVYDNMPAFFRYIADNNNLPMHSFLETRGILCWLVSRFLKFAGLKTRCKDDRVNRCIQYINANIDTNITLHQLSDISCVSVDHLIRIFKKELNSTPTKYINHKKIEKAQLLLLTTDMHIIDIALTLSIDNIPYFNRLFKQYTGLTPGRYRSTHGNGVQAYEKAAI